MACPHGSGDPRFCSQCHGATARIVAIRGREVLVDGVVIATTIEHATSAEEVMLAKPHARRGGAARRTCRSCGQPGHNVRTCPRRGGQ